MYNQPNNKKKPTMASEMFEAAMPKNAGGTEQAFEAGNDGMMIGSNVKQNPFKSSESQTVNLNEFMQSNKLGQANQKKKPNLGI